MRDEAVRSLWAHLLALVVWGTGFYALILNPYVLDDLVKGAIIGFMGLALQWEFGTAVQGATARQAANATAASVAAQPTTTVSVPPATVTTTPAVNGPAEEDIP